MSRFSPGESSTTCKEVDSNLSNHPGERKQIGRAFEFLAQESMEQWIFYLFVSYRIQYRCKINATQRSTGGILRWENERIKIAFQSYARALRYFEQYDIHIGKTDNNGLFDKENFSAPFVLLSNIWLPIVWCVCDAGMYFIFISNLHFRSSTKILLWTISLHVALNKDHGTINSGRYQETPTIL